ncbi:MAG: HNH endonuclease signature motif containing protein [Candidatus Shapirobacteria bacterium]|jgi:hypothetical protein
MSRRKKPSFCLSCGKEFYCHYSSFGKYCSLSCQHEYQTKLEIEKWLRGDDNPMNTNGLLRPWARKYLFKKYNNTCCLCGWGEINQTTGKIPLEVDHIDGSYKNNGINNLRLLCPNCHSLTSTYKNLNKGNGRNKRNHLR